MSGFWGCCLSACALLLDWIALRAPDALASPPERVAHTMKSAATAATPRADDAVPTTRAQNATIESLRRENEELRKEIAALEGYRTLAYRDALTGLWNRRY